MPIRLDVDRADLGATTMFHPAALCPGPTQVRGVVDRGYGGIVERSQISDRGGAYGSVCHCLWTMQAADGLSYELQRGLQRLSKNGG